MIDITTQMQIKASPHAVYEAYVNPELIGNFWFSQSSERWEAGKTVELYFDEFSVHFPIEILEAVPDKKLVFSWGGSSDQRVVTIRIISEKPDLTFVVISEEGYREYEDLLTNPELTQVLQQEYPEIIGDLLDSKGGWTFSLTCLKAYLEDSITTLRTGLLP